METHERRRREMSSKTSKTGGKRIKAVTAEEEARRREELKEKLREKLELEKKAHQVVERLLEDRVAEDVLVECAKFITPSNYKDAIEERFIAKLCGYPICLNKLGKIPTQQYKISTKTNKVYDITERKCFCSNFCYKASKEFELQISKTPLWLRQDECPPEIKLMKRGDCGSSGEEVILSGRPLQEEDIEKPLSALPEDPQNDHSGNEQEQDFVSSVISQKPGPRVHWGDLPKRTQEDLNGEQLKIETRRKQRKEGDKGGAEHCESRGKEKKAAHASKSDIQSDAENLKQLYMTNTDQALPVEKDMPRIEEATAKLNLCSSSQVGTHNTSLLAVSLHTTPLTPTSSEGLNYSTESTPQLEPPPSFPTNIDNQNSHSTMLQNQANIKITQVGMSKKGAAGLRDLLKNQNYVPTLNSIRLNLLESLKKILKEWSTDETLKFLYGADHSLGSPFADVEDEKRVEEEDLDEDDLEDDVTVEDRGKVDDKVQKRPSAAAPDYEALQNETQHLELRVREFYKGTWILPDLEEQNGNKMTVQDQCPKEPVLPLVDSHAQCLIQKRITVEKLNSGLSNIVGPLHLTMSDITTDLNNLVRTFRFTNTNIIHKAPEWTLIAVVLLHLLSEVSSVVREALEMPASVDYLNTLMYELGLQEQDLLNLVRLFKTPTH